MRKEQALVLDDEDENVAAVLVELGLPRNVARSLVYLAHVDEAVSADVEHGAGLRQPEVSMAMRFLRHRDWVAKRDIKRQGKGRPLHCYRLARDLDEIVAVIEKEKRAEAERNLQLVTRLRALAQGLNGRQSGA